MTLHPLFKPKGYSPTRRWLRAERAREHREAIALDVETVMDWRPSRAPAVEIVSRLWRVPVDEVLAEISPDVGRAYEMAADLNAYVRSLKPIALAPHQDVDTSTDETIFYTGQGRIE